jgi:hypothetical protein
MGRVGTAPITSRAQEPFARKIGAALSPLSYRLVSLSAFVFYEIGLRRLCLRMAYLSDRPLGLRPAVVADGGVVRI